VVNKEKVIAASRDYLYLKRRLYSTRSILEIVGNHYQLNTEERNVLYRGFVAKTDIKHRRYKVLGEKQVRGKVLKIDGYNQLITIESYRKGNFVFVASDGVVRDSASVHRSYKPSPFTEEILNKLLKNLNSLELERIEFYYILKRAELVATSDSVIIDEVKNIFDLAGWFIHRIWKAKLTDFRVY